MIFYSASCFFFVSGNFTLPFVAFDCLKSLFFQKAKWIGLMLAKGRFKLLQSLHCLLPEYRRRKFESVWGKRDSKLKKKSLGRDHQSPFFMFTGNFAVLNGFSKKKLRLEISYSMTKNHAVSLIDAVLSNVRAFICSSLTSV